MRLIDADVLHAKIYEDSERSYGANANIAQVLLRIETAPTIQPEVRHGRWIENRTDLICSACRWEYSDELRFMSHHGLDAVEEAFAYCPHCGADMREVSEDAGTD